MFCQKSKVNNIEQRTKAEFTKMFFFSWTRNCQSQMNVMKPVQRLDGYKRLFSLIVFVCILSALNIRTDGPTQTV